MHIPVSTAVALLFLILGTAQAHHYFASEYERELRGTLVGVVEEVWFNNPHVQVKVAVSDENGRVEIWAANTVSPNSLRHRGWIHDTIKEGERLTLEGFLGRDGAKRLWIQMLALEDGTVIYPVGTEDAAATDW